MSKKNKENMLDFQLDSQKKLIEILEDEKIDLAISVLSKLNRGQLDKMKAKNPQLVNYILEHYEKYSKAENLKVEKK